jgi:hypothetical protein
VSWWDRLRDGARQASAPPELVEERPVPRRRRAAEFSEDYLPGPLASPGERDRYPDVADVAPRGRPVVLNADLLMAEGEVLVTGMGEVQQPEAGVHTWVVAVWYQVNPLELRDGGRFSMHPDQVVGTLPPACYFCEVQWTFSTMRTRCPGQPPKTPRVPRR